MVAGAPAGGCRFHFLPRMAPSRKFPPDKSEILLMPPFEGLPLEAIRVPQSPQQLQGAWDDLHALRFVGFDTESKPTFLRGEVSAGPDVVQFATLDAGYVFLLRHPECHDLVRALLAAPALVKVGFGLDSDHTQLFRRLGARVTPVLDLDVLFHRRGYPRTLGVKGAMAVVARQRFTKSKHVTTSNWSLPELQPRQLLYAANDAHAALRVLDALALPESELPIAGEGFGPPPGRARRP